MCDYHHALSTVFVTNICNISPQTSFTNNFSAPTSLIVTCLCVQQLNKFLHHHHHSQVADLKVSYKELLPESGSDGSRSVDIESTVDLSDTDFTDSQRSALFTVLKKHSTMFDGHVGHTTLITHQIDTGDHSPIRHAPR